MVAERRGDPSAAVTHLRRATASAPLPFFEGALIRALRLAGDRAEADDRERALAATGRSPAIAFAIAIARLPMGDADAVMPALLQAADARDPFAQLVPLRVWWYDGIRGDARFAEFAERLQLPESAWREPPAVRTP